MKILFIILMTVFLGKGCDAEQKQEVETAVIEYTATTRGFFQKIIVQNQKFGVSKNRDNEQPVVDQQISSAEWKKIIDAFQEVDLDGIPALKSPSQKRFYDGAAIATLKITYKDKTYETEPFDHGNPPAEIEKLVNKITVLALPKE